MWSQSKDSCHYNKKLKRDKNWRGEILLYCIAQISAFEFIIKWGNNTEQDTPPHLCLPFQPPYSSN